jgi:serine/threonine protein kinase
MRIHCIFHLFTFAELVVGGNLGEFYRTSPRISWKDRYDFALQLAKGKLAASSIFAHMTAVSGLAYLHNENVIHNDIKETNVLVAQEGGKKVLKFTDFGARACPSLS